MRDLHLTPENLLPAITPQDQEFAQKIVKEFDLSIDEISWLVRDIRNGIETGGIAAECKEDSKLRSSLLHLEKLFAPKVKIKELNITTDRGTVKIKSSDPMFRYFNSPIIRMRRKLEKELKQENDYLNSLSKKTPVNKIFLYFYEATSLNKNQVFLAIGMLMIHFQLFGNKPLWTEKEFDPDSGYYDYKHYLSDRVRRRLKKLISEYPI